MKNIDVEAFKKEGFTFEEIQDISDSERDYEKSGITYSLEEVQIIGNEIIKKRSNELKKDLLNSGKINLERKEIAYV